MQFVIGLQASTSVMTASTVHSPIVQVGGIPHCFPVEADAIPDFGIEDAQAVGDALPYKPMVEVPVGSDLPTVDPFEGVHSPTEEQVRDPAPLDKGPSVMSRLPQRPTDLANVGDISPLQAMFDCFKKSMQQVNSRLDRMVAHNLNDLHKTVAELGIQVGMLSDRLTDLKK